MSIDIDIWLRLLAEKDGSDLYLSTGAPPCMKVDGELKTISSEKLAPGEIMEIAQSVLDEEQREAFHNDLEMNLARTINKVGRFRINIFQQRNEVSIVARNIKMDIPSADDLKLPEVLRKLVMVKRGLVLFVGGTGTGKSTSLAALIDLRNATTAGHIITIEDPVEFVHNHKKCIVNQREVGVDTRSFHAALKNTLRQAPDVILIGEIRDRETMEHALAFAETGHLCISTLHANSANQALDRVINFFPEERRPQLLSDLANNLQGFVSQRLIPTVDGSRAAAFEIMLGSRTIKDKIQRGDLYSIKEIMEKSNNLGMQTFDQHLFRLVKEGKVSEDTAVSFSDSPNNLRLKFKLDNPDAVANDEEANSLSLSSIDGEEPDEPIEVAFAPPAPPAEAPPVSVAPMNLELQPTDQDMGSQLGGKLGNG